MPGTGGLDSDLFPPKAWADDPVRRAAAFIPDEVVYPSEPGVRRGQPRSS
ncbi:MAG: hypothetical protein AAB341_02520 [Planctomycetota bacterium]